MEVGKQVGKYIILHTLISRSMHERKNIIN